MKRSAERSAEPDAWAVINEGDGEMIDVTMVKPDDAPGMRYEPLYSQSEAEGDVVAALQGALLCIEDEVNIYAPEMCDAKRVEEARARHSEGGTLHYYATNIKACRDALGRSEEASDGKA